MPHWLLYIFVVGYSVQTTLFQLESISVCFLIECVQGCFSSTCTSLYTVAFILAEYVQNLRCRLLADHDPGWEKATMHNHNTLKHWKTSVLIPAMNIHTMLKTMSYYQYFPYLAVIISMHTMDTTRTSFRTLDTQHQKPPYGNATSLIYS